MKPTKSLLPFLAAIAVATVPLQAATLVVDFSRNLANADPLAAVFQATAGSNQSRTYLFNTQGYTGSSSMDTGSGVTVGLRTINVSDGSFASQALVSADRDSSKTDLLSDWFSVEGTGFTSAASPNPLNISYGYQIIITGIQTGTYDFSSMHRDSNTSGIQAGVFDAQYSVDGGTNWINLLDNATYNATTPLIELSNLSLTDTDGFAIRYAAGGALYGGNSVNRSGGNGNRQLPLNSIEFTLVPEPSAALLGGLGMLALLRRRR